MSYDATHTRAVTLGELVRSSDKPVQTYTPRPCSSCGSELSKYNAGTTCGSCTPSSGWS